MITENENLIKINNNHDEHGSQKKDIMKKKFTENLKADARANVGVPVPTLYK